MNNPVTARRRGRDAVGADEPAGQDPNAAPPGNGARMSSGLRALARPWLIVIILAVLFPLVVDNQYYVGVGVQAGVFVCLAIGLNVVVGFAGLLDLGFAAFFALGAYSTGILTSTYHWSVLETLPVGVACALVGAVVVGVPTLRLRSDYLAIVTLGFGEIIATTANNLHFTGGATGLFGIPPFSIGSFTVTTDRGYYYVFLIMAVIFAFATYRLRHSRSGRAWLCIREDEDAAGAMGIKTYRYKLYAYMAGAVIGALTGSFYAPALSAIAPTSFQFEESLLILIAVSIGGMGSIWGAILGGVIVEAVPELARSFSQGRLLVFGVVLVLMMMLRPQGLIPEGGFGLPDIFRNLGRRAKRPLYSPAGSPGESHTEPPDGPT